MSATEFITRTLRCPVCLTLFTADQTAVPPLVGRDSDLRPLFAGRDPLPAMVLTCPTCRYSSLAEGFEQPEASEDDSLGLTSDLGDRPLSRPRLPREEEVELLRRYLRSPEFVEGVGGGEPVGAARYLLAARCYEFLNDEDLAGGADLFLRGSWCARSMGQPELERRCQREAASRLVNALAKNQIREPDRPRAVYLAAELHRRVGDFTRAVDGFEQLKTLVDEDDEEGRLWAESGRRLSALATVKSSINAEWAQRQMRGDDE